MSFTKLNRDLIAIGVVTAARLSVTCEETEYPSVRHIAAKALLDEMNLHMKHCGFERVFVQSVPSTMHKTLFALNMALCDNDAGEAAKQMNILCEIALLHMQKATAQMEAA